MPGPKLKPFDILELSKKLVTASYSLTTTLPQEEKTNLSLYIREAAVKAYLSTMKAVFRKKKKDKKRSIKNAKNALVIIDAVIEVLVEVNLVTEEATTEVLKLSSTCYGALDRLKKRK